jgi:hypothetical protein
VRPCPTRHTKPVQFEQLPTSFTENTSFLGLLNSSPLLLLALGGLLCPPILLVLLLFFLSSFLLVLVRLVEEKML